jgi:hypothetical protein
VQAIVNRKFYVMQSSSAVAKIASAARRTFDRQALLFQWQFDNAGLQMSELPNE